MSEVAMPIGGKTYRVACAAGEEERVARLGAAINDKLAAMGNLSGHEAQNLLFAALLLADEVHEGRDIVAKADAEIAAAKAMAGTSVGEIEELKAALANRDAELDQLRQTSIDGADALRLAEDRCAELGERLTERQANEAMLQEQVDTLSRERDELAARPLADPGVEAQESDLAPALERLAEMLEETADKLERGAPTP